MGKQKKEQIPKTGIKTVQARLSQDYYEKLQMVPGNNTSEKVRALIDGNHYLYMPEMVTASVELKDAIYEAERFSDISYMRIWKAGNEICRLLSTN